MLDREDAFLQSLPISPMDFLQLAAILLIFLVPLGLLAASRFQVAFADIPGPISRSWLFGHMLEFVLSAPYGLHEFEWQRQYGSAYAIKGCFGTNRLVLSDPAALRHVLSELGDFKKTPQQQFSNKHVLGADSILHAEGQHHRRLRSAMLPAFSSNAVRAMLPQLQNLAEELRTELEELLEQAPETTPIVDVLPAIHQITLKAVTAFMGYDMSKDSTYISSYKDVLVNASKRTKGAYLIRSIFMALPGGLRDMMQYLPSSTFTQLLALRRASFNRAHSLVMSKIEARNLGAQLTDNATPFDAMLEAHYNKPGSVSLKEIKEQFGTLAIAGEDTSANAVLWALFELSRRPQWQDRIREEVRHGDRGTPQFYDRMPYLNAVIKEVLRLYSPVPCTERVAVHDTVVPLSTAVMSRAGQKVTCIPVKKGQHVQVAIASYNRLVSIWGDDALQFNPSRWLSDNAADKCATGALGPYANLMTFIGGPRTCIGWRFALLEIQVILSELVAHLCFENHNPAAIKPVSAISLAPLSGDSTNQFGMPLKISLV